MRGNGHTTGDIFGGKTVNASAIIQTVVALVIAGLLTKMAGMLSDGHDTLNKIHQVLQDKLPAIEMQLGDHETRIRMLERDEKGATP